MAFAPELRLTLFAVVFLPVLLGLGGWQLERAAEKRAVEQRLADARSTLVRATALADLDAQPELTVVRVVGRMDRERAVLVDNRTHEGRPGYELFVPLRATAPEGDEGGPEAVLVGLGWLPAPPVRSSLPEFELPAGPVAITGLIDGRAGDVPVFGEIAEAGWPLRVQRLDVEGIATAAALRLARRPVMADAGEPGVQQHVHDPVRMPSSTHTGYAVQWFGLAAVLAAGWVFASARRGRQRRRDGDLAPGATAPADERQERNG